METNLNNSRDSSIHRNFGGQCSKDNIASYVLLAGSKARVRKFAEHWKNSKQVADHYGFLVYTGEYKGFSISACSTGIGGMSVSIAVEELCNLGANTFLRVGVTSPLVDEIEYGDVVIAKGAVRWDGTSNDYVRTEYPALAHIEVIMASICAAEQLGLKYKVGIIGDMASLGPDKLDGYRHFLTNRVKPMKQELYKVGILDGTGEAAAMLIPCSIYGFRAGVININAVDKAQSKWNPNAEEEAISMGLETMQILMQWDQLKNNEGADYWVPEIPNSK